MMLPRHRTFCEVWQSTDKPAAQTSRDRHLQLVAEQGAVGWQRITGYGRRNFVETATGRCTHLIDPELHARALPGQQGKTVLAGAALNRMIQVAQPVSMRRT